MSRPKDSHIEELREEAKQYEKETGRPVAIDERIVECSNGTRTHSFGYKTRPRLERTAREAAQLILKSGLKPLRDEDGVVRLYWKEVELGDAAPAETAKTGEKTSKAGIITKTGKSDQKLSTGGALGRPEALDRYSEPIRGHVEQIAWPIRSPETSNLISFFLFEQGWDTLAPRELKETVRILEGSALRYQQPIDTAQAAERSPLLAAILFRFDLLSRGWFGSATRLLSELKQLCEQEGMDWANSPDWPQNAQSVSVELRRISRWLADEGISYSRTRVGKERRQILRYTSELEQADDAAEWDEEPDFEEPAAALPSPADDAEAVDTVENTAEAAPASPPASSANSLDERELQQGVTQGDAPIDDFATASKTPAPTTSSQRRKADRQRYEALKEQH